MDAASSMDSGGGGTATRELSADDQEMVRTGFRLILDSPPGIEVVGEAADGIECVESARRLRPDVCLVGIRMPGPDGLEVTRALTGPGVAEPTRVVIVTAFDQDDYVHTAVRGGACGFLLTDAAPSLLIEAVRSAARGDALVSPAPTVRLPKELGNRPAAPAEAEHPLTDRESDVVRLVAVGCTHREIRERLFLSLSTVETHLSSVKDKWDVRNRVEIAARAWEAGEAGDREAPAG